jgi:hypothetical protein
MLLLVYSRCPEVSHCLEHVLAFVMSPHLKKPVVNRLDLLSRDSRQELIKSAHGYEQHCYGSRYPLCMGRLINYKAMIVTYMEA